MPDLPPLELDHFTAEPILRLLLGLRGHDAEYFSVPEGWAAFKDFARLPTPLEDRGATFQMYPAEASDGQVEVFFGRQITGPIRGHRTDRMVGLHLLFDNPGHHVEPIELWSEDLPGLEAFLARVEELDTPFLTDEAPLFMVTFINEEEEPGG